MVKRTLDLGLGEFLTGSKQYAWQLPSENCQAKLLFRGSTGFTLKAMNLAGEIYPLASDVTEFRFEGTILNGLSVHLHTAIKNDVWAIVETADTPADRDWETS